MPSRLEVHTADAGDAGGLGSLRPADARCWRSGVLVCKVRPTDADDAGDLGSLCADYAQQTLMTLAVWGLCVQSAPS